MAIKDIILDNNQGIQTAIDLLDTLEDKGIDLTGMSISKLQVFNVEFTSNATSVDHPLGEIPRICIGWMVSCTNTSAMYYVQGVFKFDSNIYQPCTYGRKDVVKTTSLFIDTTTEETTTYTNSKIQLGKLARTETVYFPSGSVWNFIVAV